MNEFDQFIKQDLKIKYYIRYTDDFLIISNNKQDLGGLILKITRFLKQRLSLELHPDKINIIKLERGVDFLGYVTFPYHRLMRKRTERRILRKLNEKEKMYKLGLISKKSFKQTLQSYLGVLSHANTHRLRESLQNRYWCE